MAITIKREKNNRGVPLRGLQVGATFLYDNRVGVVVERNGHQFYLDLTTCHNFRKNDDLRWDTYYKNNELDPETIVLPIEVELTYKVVG